MSNVEHFFAELGCVGSRKISISLKIRKAKAMPNNKEVKGIIKGDLKKRIIRI